jgi:hypothetical protein
MDFPSSTRSLMSVKEAMKEGMILVPRSTPTVPMGVGRMMLWFGDD